MWVPVVRRRDVGCPFGFPTSDPEVSTYHVNSWNHHRQELQSGSPSNSAKRMEHVRGTAAYCVRETTYPLQCDGEARSGEVGGVRTTVVIADDHALVRRGTREILNQDGSIEVVGEAADGAGLIDLVKDLRPKVAVVDIGMPGLNGIEATKIIKERWPETAVVILSVNDDEEYILGAIEAGASGYLTKDVVDADLVRAVVTAGSGGATLGRVAASAVMNRVRSSSLATQIPEDELTARELEVLQLAAGGLSNRAIADELDLSPRTVEVHLHHVFQKLGVTSRTQAVVVGARRGLIDLEDS